MTIEITTKSGAIYFVTGDKVTGGSRNLEDAELVSPVQIGLPLLILTPDGVIPAGIITTAVVKIEPVKEVEP